MRNEFFKVKKEASANFGDQLDQLANANPTKRVSIRNSIDLINEDILLDPKVRTAANRVPEIKAMLQNPKLADNITLRESQNIINRLTSRVSKTKLQGNNVRPDDIPLLDLIDDIRMDQLDAFPQMQGVRQQYAQVIGRYNEVRNKIKVGRLLGNIERNFGDAEIQKVVKELLPEDVISEMGGFRTAIKFLKFAPWVVGAGIAKEKVLDPILGAD